MPTPQKTVVVGAGPVGSLAALYAAKRGHDVEVYELRPGTCALARCPFFSLVRRRLATSFQVHCIIRRELMGIGGRSAQPGHHPS